jgi:hypothetical protein
VFVGDSLPLLTFDKLLWMGYFRLAVTFITSPLVQIDSMKRQVSWHNEAFFSLAFYQKWCCCSERLIRMKSFFYQYFR